MDQKIVQAISTYYEDNAKKLRFTVNQIFHRHYGGVNGKDIEEFYGIGTDVLFDIWNKNKEGKETFDFSKGDFDGYVYNAIRMAIIDEFKRQNRDKRKTKVFLLDENGDKVIDEKTGKPIKVPVPDIRLDAPLKEGEYTSLIDMIPFDVNIESFIEDNTFEDKDEYSPPMKEYLGKLSKIQLRVLELIADDYIKDEIVEMLHIDSKLYNDCIAAIKSYSNTKCITSLRRNKDVR